MYDPLPASLESGFFLMDDDVDDVDVDVDERIGATTTKTHWKKRVHKTDIILSIY